MTQCACIHHIWSVFVFHELYSPCPTSSVSPRKLPKWPSDNSHYSTENLVVSLRTFVALVLLDIVPHGVISLDLDGLGRVEFLQSAQIHWALEKGQDVFVKGLPVSFHRWSIFEEKLRGVVVIILGRGEADWEICISAEKGRLTGWRGGILGSGGC